MRSECHEKDPSPIVFSKVPEEAVKLPAPTMRMLLYSLHGFSQGLTRLDQK
jgi:hypothetical protein